MSESLIYKLSYNNYFIFTISNITTLEKKQYVFFVFKNQLPSSVFQPSMHKKQQRKQTEIQMKTVNLQKTTLKMTLR